MSAYRDDFDAALRRASALEAELDRLRLERREEIAGFRVKAQELGADLEAARCQLAELDLILRALWSSPGDGERAAKLEAVIEAHRRRLAELDTAIIDLKDVDGPRAGQRASALFAGSLRRRAQLVLGAASAAIIIAGCTVGAVLYLELIKEQELAEQREEAMRSLALASFPEAVDAASFYHALLYSRQNDPEVLAEAARVHADLALEFATNGDAERAEVLLQLAEAAGADLSQLEPTRIAVAIARGDFIGADQRLVPATWTTGYDAPELIYLRGRWFMAQGDPAEAFRRFAAASDAWPDDVRILVAMARAEVALGSHSAAIETLGRVEALSPGNVAARLLRARIDIDTGRDPVGGERVLEWLLDERPRRAAPSQVSEAYRLQEANRYASDVEDAVKRLDGSEDMPILQLE